MFYGKRECDNSTLCSTPHRRALNTLRGPNTKKKNFVCFNAMQFNLWSGVRTWYHKHKNKFFKVTIAMVTMLITP